MDPANLQTLNDEQASSAIFTGMIELNDQANTYCELCTSYSVAPDSVTWTFHLRSGLKFSDGTPLTSADVVYSINRALDPKTLSATGPYYLRYIKDASVFAAGSKTITTLISIILRWLVFDWLTYALLFLSLIALFEHLVLLSPSFPFSLVHVVAFAFIGLFALLQALAGFFSPRVRSRENRLALTLGVYAVVSLLIVLVLHLAEAPLHMILFRWDWPLTLLLIGGAGGLFGLKFWLARDTRQEQQP